MLGKTHYKETFSTMFADFFMIMLDLANISYTDDKHIILAGQVQEVTSAESQCEKPV